MAGSYQLFWTVLEHEKIIQIAIRANTTGNAPPYTPFVHTNYAIFHPVFSPIALLCVCVCVGWVGFGIAEQTSGSMAGSDIVTALYDGVLLFLLHCSRTTPDVLVRRCVAGDPPICVDRSLCNCNIASTWRHVFMMSDCAESDCMVRLLVVRIGCLTVVARLMAGRR